MASHPCISQFAQYQDLLRRVFASCPNGEEESNTMLLANVLMQLNRQVYRLEGVIWEQENRIRELEEALTKEAF